MPQSPSPRGAGAPLGSGLSGQWQRKEIQKRQNPLVPPRPFLSPLGREQILRVFSSFKPSPFPQGIPLLLHFYIHPGWKENWEEVLCKFPSAHTAAGSIPCLLFPGSLAVPPLPRQQGMPAKLVFLRKNTAIL